MDPRDRKLMELSGTGPGRSDREYRQQHDRRSDRDFRQHDDRAGGGDRRREEEFHPRDRSSRDINNRRRGDDERRRSGYTRDSDGEYDPEQMLKRSIMASEVKVMERPRFAKESKV